jgi:uncharacterized membrane protein YvbJ
MFCSSCGQELAQGAAFCSGCGSAVVASVAAPAAAREVRVQNVYRGKNTQIAGMAILVIGLLIAIGGGDYIMPGVLTMLGGIAVIIIGRFVHWYHAE